MDPENFAVHALTVRAWIATQALAGLLAGSAPCPEAAARQACEYADALLDVLACTSRDCPGATMSEPPF